MKMFTSPYCRGPLLGLVFLCALPPGVAKSNERFEAFGRAMTAMSSPWSYNREQFNQAITFSDEEVNYLYSQFSVAAPSKEMVYKLAAINCAFSPPLKSRHFLLYQYRCGQRNFDDFASLYLPGDYSILRFVKEEDRLRSLQYLEEYLTLFENSDCEKSICLLEQKMKRLRGLVEYLRAGGSIF